MIKKFFTIFFIISLYFIYITPNSYGKSKDVIKRVTKTEKGLIGENQTKRQVYELLEIRMLKEASSKEGIVVENITKLQNNAIVDEFKQTQSYLSTKIVKRKESIETINGVDHAVLELTMDINVSEIQRMLLQATERNDVVNDLNKSKNEIEKLNKLLLESQNKLLADEFNKTIEERKNSIRSDFNTTLSLVNKSLEEFGNVQKERDYEIRVQEEAKRIVEEQIEKENEELKNREKNANNKLSDLEKEREKELQEMRNNALRANAAILLTSEKSLEDSKKELMEQRNKYWEAKKKIIESNKKYYKDLKINLKERIKYKKKSRFTESKPAYDKGATPQDRKADKEAFELRKKDFYNNKEREIADLEYQLKNINVGREIKLLKELQKYLEPFMDTFSRYQNFDYSDDVSKALENKYKTKCKNFNKNNQENIYTLDCTISRGLINEKITFEIGSDRLEAESINKGKDLIKSLPIYGLIADGKKRNKEYLKGFRIYHSGLLVDDGNRYKYVKSFIFRTPPVIPEITDYQNIVSEIQAYEEEIYKKSIAEEEISKKKAQKERAKIARKAEMQKYSLWDPIGGYEKFNTVGLVGYMPLMKQAYMFELESKLVFRPSDIIGFFLGFKLVLDIEPGLLTTISETGESSQKEVTDTYIGPALGMGFNFFLNNNVYFLLDGYYLAMMTSNSISPSTHSSLGTKIHSSGMVKFGIGYQVLKQIKSYHKGKRAVFRLEVFLSNYYSEPTNYRALLGFGMYF